MRKLALGLVAAATVLTAAPAMAQHFGYGDRDFSVRIGPGADRGDRWDRWDRPRHHGYYARGGDCRFITERRRRPDGSVVVRRIRDCD
jgi:hypothetical protein